MEFICAYLSSHLSNTKTVQINSDCHCELHITVRVGYVLLVTWSMWYISTHSLGFAPSVMELENEASLRYGLELALLILLLHRPCGLSECQDPDLPVD